MSYNPILKDIKSISVIENESKNTKEEIANAILACYDNGAKYLLRVTNPSHELRCISTQNDLLKAYSDHVEYVFSILCETDFSENEQVLIFEPHQALIEPVQYLFSQ